MIAKKTETKIENVAIVMHQSPIRNAEKIEVAKEFKIGMLFLEKTYGFTKIDDIAILQLVKMLRESYGWINYEEMLLAFRLAAAGQLETKIVMYDGIFNLAKVGEILNNYKSYRNRIKNVATQLEMEQQEYDRQQELLSPAGQERVNAKIWATIKQHALTITEPNNVPSYYYDFLIQNRENFNPSYEEKKEAYETAKIEVKKELENKRYSDTSIANIFKRAMTEFEQVVKDKAIVRAQKKIVFNYLKNQIGI